MKFRLKDPGSAITHGIGMLLAVAGATPLIVKAARSADVLHVFAVPRATRLNHRFCRLLLSPEATA